MLQHCGRRCRRLYYRGWSGWCWKERVMIVVVVAVCVSVYFLTAWFDAANTSSDKDGHKTKSSLAGIPGRETFEYLAKLVPRAGKKLNGGSVPTGNNTKHTGVNEEQNGTVRMRKRQEILSQYCRHAQWDDMGGDSHFRTNIIVSKHRPLLYCPVGKMASTFVSRFLVAAEETNPVISPYLIPPDKAIRMRRKHTGTNMLFMPLIQMFNQAGLNANEPQLMESLTRVLFVRNPFHRLWSAYVDKLLFPNPYYWENWGYPAISSEFRPAINQPGELSVKIKTKGLLSLNRIWGYPAMNTTTVFRATNPSRSTSNDLYRQGPSEEKRYPFTNRSWGYLSKYLSKTEFHHRHLLEQTTGAGSSMECGQSVTFSQFIEFTLTDLYKSDAHVRPVARECSPCYVNYDVIGHVETLKADILHLANLLHLNNATLSVLNWDEEHARDAIKDGVNSVFVKFASRIKKCMTLEEAARRLWRVLQIRGSISDKINYPSRLADNKTLSSTVMEEALLKARSESARNKEELDGQRSTAFLNAYQTVSAQLKDRIRQTYEADFKMLVLINCRVCRHTRHADFKFGFDQLSSL